MTFNFRSPLRHPVHKPRRAFLLGTMLFVAGFICSGPARSETDSASSDSSQTVRQVIGDITVQGNFMQKKKTVLSKVKARKGDVVVDPTFRADVDRLLETG